jgi:hypothetical protein
MTGVMRNMDMFSLIVGIIIASGVWAYLFLPYLLSRGPGRDDGPEAEEDLREQLMVQLAELEYDFKTGKMTREDYELLRRQTESVLFDMKDAHRVNTPVED